MDLNSYLYSSLIALIQLSALVYSANWAQSSGTLKQNVVIPYIPSSSNSHWTARYGSVAVMTEKYVYLLGGDSYQDGDGVKDQTTFTGNVIDRVGYNGYKNDVWRMKGSEWYVKGNIRLRTNYGQKQPEVRSNIQWININPGLFPPPRVTYENWITPNAYPTVQWSPRRHHCAVFFNNYIWVLGGRARELVDFSEARSVGGILSPRVEDPSNHKQKFTRQREASVVKNDVWQSLDGITWTLVTPGCKRPQKELVSKQYGNRGTVQDICSVDSDCYGNEKCVQNTCVCQMWSPREQFAIAVHNKFMYVSGGYVSQLYNDLSACGKYACGDTDASGYRYYMSDLWKSSDGMIWTELTFDTFNGGGGRGGHQLLSFPNLKNQSQLWILGGRGGDNTGASAELTYYNDIWYSPIASSGEVNNWNVSTPPWSPRSGHAAVYEPAVPFNNYVRRVYVIGGQIDATTSMNDVWVWRPDYDALSVWNKDFTATAFYQSGNGGQYVDTQGSPTMFYVYPDGDVSLLNRFFVPSKFRSHSNPDLPIGRSSSLRPNSSAYIGLPLEFRPYLAPDKLQYLYDAGVYTIRQLANANQTTILNLRGYDIPEVPQSKRLKFFDVCNARALAQAVLTKCEVNMKREIYDGEKQMPWNVIPVFNGPPPPVQNVEWHGRPNYNFLQQGDDYISSIASTDPELKLQLLTEKWDGCTYTPDIEGVYGVNVAGIGFVSQVAHIDDPFEIIQELVCRQTPSPRVHQAAVYSTLDDSVYVFGGKTLHADGTYDLNADTWYRISRLPTGIFSSTPRSKTSDSVFEFNAIEPGVTFEYRVWDPVNYKELRPWTPATHKTDVSWLNWRRGGPSNGFYTVYIRAIDPAGNKDAYYMVGTNVYMWIYISPTPWDIILEVIFSIAFVALIAVIEYRRRERKAAMERYAMKRLRRKFKAMQRDADEGAKIDWRVLYKETLASGDSKQLKRAKALSKRMKEKRREKRETLNKQRQKEKEKIKRKLIEAKLNRANVDRIYIDNSQSKEELDNQLMLPPRTKLDDFDDFQQEMLSGNISSKDLFRMTNSQQIDFIESMSSSKRFKAYEVQPTVDSRLLDATVDETVAAPVRTKLTSSSAMRSRLKSQSKIHTDENIAGISDDALDGFVKTPNDRLQALVQTRSHAANTVVSRGPTPMMIDEDTTGVKIRKVNKRYHNATSIIATANNSVLPEG